MSTPSAVSDRAVFLSPEPPYPLAGGGALRSASLLELLARFFRVHLITFAVEGADDPADALPAGLVERTTTVRLPRHANSAAARLGRNGWRLLRGKLPLSDRFGRPQSRAAVERAVSGNDYALALVEHFWCADYLAILRPRAGCVMLNLHNIESVLHAGCAASEPFPQRLAHSRFRRTAERREREMIPKFDRVLVPSAEDADRLRRISPAVRSVVYPNSIPFVPRYETPEEHFIAFSGNLEYHPNVAAVKHFLRHVWPSLRDKQPELRWKLIGKNEFAVRSLVADDPRIELSGAVPDAIGELARARLVVVPLLAGSGTRVKILEAWAAARAVVSTPIGAEGLPARNRENILIVDTLKGMTGTKEMTGAILELLNDPALRKRLGDAGRATYEQHHCWPAAWKSFEPELERILASRTSSVLASAPGSAPHSVLN